MWWQKIIHLKNGSKVNFLYKKHGDQKRWNVQTFTFAHWVGGLNV
jgi:hypothetical protein